MEFAFARQCSFSGSRVMRQFVGKCEIGQIWPIMISDDLIFDMTSEMDEEALLWFFYILSNSAYRVSLRGPGAELKCTLSMPPPQQVVENLEVQQGAG